MFRLGTAHTESTVRLKFRAARSGSEEDPLPRRRFSLLGVNGIKYVSDGMGRDGWGALWNMKCEAR